MVGVLLCDQSTAFDLCDHYLLTEKLKLMGVEENAAAWFCSYLSSRKQSCMVDGQLSDPIEIPPCGVPQGSIRGPKSGSSSHPWSPSPVSGVESPC